MPPAPPDPSVGRACGPVGAARLIEVQAPQTPSAPQAHSDSARRHGKRGKPQRRSSALEALLVDLGSQIHRGTSDSQSEEAAQSLRLCPTGLTALDAQLGGGFPYGRLSEICGAPSSGRTSLALNLLAETLERGVLAAWIDLADAFDPASAIAAMTRGSTTGKTTDVTTDNTTGNTTNSDLERLLWVRARSEDEALRSCERLLQTEGFELIILDLALKDVAIRDVSWLRLARLAASTRTVLVALSDASATGSRAELVLEMKPLGARFVGPPSLLDSLETTAVLKRHRSRPTGDEVLFSMGVEPGETR
jgi:hypothetical protein